MKNAILSAAFAALALGAQAQVTNYALSLTEPTACVNLGERTDLNGVETFTLQLWVCPAEWTPGARLISRGDMALSLGAEAGVLTWTNGTKAMTFSATPLAAGEWHHITLTSNAASGQVALYVDHDATATVEREGAQALSTTSEPLVIGGQLKGRIDEVRVWDIVLTDEYERFWRTTLNEYCPEWKRLRGYYTFDQYLCPAAYDYSEGHHHGTFSTTGAQRAEVTDNAAFRYRINLAYADWNRYFDRQVDAEKYRLSNYVSMIGIKTAKDGSATLQYPFHEATLEKGARWMAEYEGRKGVVSLDGADGTRLNLGTGVMESTDGYTFMTMIYLEEWTEGAYIFRKERSETEGFSIRLGSADTRQVIVRCNGHEYIRDKKLNVGQWTHLAVNTNITTYKGEVFLFTFDGTGAYPSRGNFPDELYPYTLDPMRDVEATIGEGGLKAKLDETQIWNSVRSVSHVMDCMAKGTPYVPGPSMKCDAAVMRTADAYYDYDRSWCPGYDLYSYRHYFNTMRECYGNCHGQHLVICASAHDGWETTLADATKRQRLAEELAEIANLPDFDGLDLDFEWTYSTTGWRNYALLCKAIREHLAPGRTLSISPHQVAYVYPTDMMEYVDFFNFQIYGPGQTYLFTAQGYDDALRQFVKHGYPNDKIVMSYATTTSGGCDANGNVIRTGNAITHAPVGYRSFYDAAVTRPDDERALYGGNYYYYTGYDETVRRARVCHDADLGGIMYWDMGNDIATSNPASLARAASLSLNANVVPLYTDVDGSVLPSAITCPTVSEAKPAICGAYDLSGRRAEREANGIVITNGKKQIKR